MNPFDDEDGRFLVLTNAEEQYSLWPAGKPVPGGWSVAHPEDSRRASLDFVERNWTDMRPAGLARALDTGSDR
jgi:MbtH protein